MRVRWVALVLCCAAGVALAQGAGQAPVPGLAELAARAARRFPQPVRVGDLIGRAVLAPIEAQPVLGRVAALTRRADGGTDVVVHAGGVLGLGGRDVAVPAEAVGLLGEHVALLDITPGQLAALPAAARQPGLAAGETVRIGLAKPFH